MSDATDFSVPVIRADRVAPRLPDLAGHGHNRWHEDIPPILEVSSGAEVEFDLRDGFDGQIYRDMDSAALRAIDFNASHPMAGPIFVKTAKPGDGIEIEIVEIDPDPVDSYGYTVILPGFGLLADGFTDPYVAHWDLHGLDFAESAQIPGIRIPCDRFIGLIGTAPSTTFRQTVVQREQALASTGSSVSLPEPAGAIPSDPAIAHTALRTIPPRENGGNLDLKQIRPGARLLLPSFVEGALVSLGDAHFAQGDGESCGSAIEMRARVRARLHVRPGLAARGLLRWPMFLEPARPAAQIGPTVGTVGLCVEAGRNYSHDLTVAARQAVMAMIRLLGTVGYSAEQAYAIASVAADLHVGQVVDTPNVGVTAILPLAIFTDGGRGIGEVLAGGRTES